MEIRKANKVEEYKTVEGIQRVIWGMIDEPPTPLPLLVALNSNGGLVEVAIEDDRIVGFSIAFPGVSGNYRYLYSHMAGVLQEYRNKNVGYLIKMHQFEEAKKMGYSEVRWTFDPMKARNTFFNVHKLGAFAYDYRINYYGIMGSKENEGVESDRIEAHKFLNRQKVTVDRYESGAVITDYPEPWNGIDVKGESLSIEIPSDLGNSNIELASRWRVALRKAIISLEERGYVMNEVAKKEKSALLIFTKKKIFGIE